jgi:protein O-mannosyl-transferase
MTRIHRSALTPPSSGPAEPPRWTALAPFAVVIAAGLFAWWRVWAATFKFDDIPLITGNDSLYEPGFLAALADLPGRVLGNRPLTWVSLRLDFALFGPGPFGPHLTNLLLHLGNGCLVFLLVRGTLRTPNVATRLAATTASGLALAVATLWVVHPLATEAVAYAAQRSTVLAAAFLLLALLATLRAADPGSSAARRIGVLIALAAAMASKEDAAAGPLLVILYERAFLLPDWRTWRRRLPWYSVLLATWIVVACCMAMGPENQTVGANRRLGVGALDWLYTQAGVVLHYARLAVWPMPLRGAYDWGIVRSFGDAWLPGLAVLALLALSIGCWRRLPWWGFVGSVFFLLLAPTSTVLPIVTEVIAERRAYLPMLAVVVALVFSGWALLRRVAGGGAGLIGTSLTVIASLTLATTTRENVGHYLDEASFWQDAYEKRDPASRTMLAAQLLSNYATTIQRQPGRQQEAHALFDLAMQCEAPNYVERTRWAVSLQERGRHDEALAALEQAIRERPDWAESHGALGTCLLMEHDTERGGKTAARLTRAVAALQVAVGLAPRRVAFWNTLAVALQRQENLVEAEAAFRRAIALPYERPEPIAGLVALLDATGRRAAATVMLDELVAARPSDAAVRLVAVRRSMQIDDRAAARQHLRVLVQLEPGNRQAVEALRELERSPGK